MSIIDLFWIIIIISFFIPIIKKRLLEVKRVQLIRSIEKDRKSRLITMIHRQESLSFLGFPFARYIDIEDSEQILRAIRLTPEEMPIDIVLHTPGGLVLAAEQIACALRRHKGKVSALVPHYAMSGGTLIALSADEIVMDDDAVLGPVDPQIGDPARGSYPAVSILKALKRRNPNRDDHTLIIGDIASKAIEQVRKKVFMLLKDRMPDRKAKKLAIALSEGRWTHDYPISMEEAQDLGMPVKNGLPKKIYELMELYPQAGQRRPSVEYIPTPYQPSPRPTKKGKG
ncbi:MAG TPA: hypothetical protein ENN38_05650 [Actinobacteria bacterium]|nr:hypothetical protein [Actinomycetota bacterium]